MLASAPADFSPPLTTLSLFGYDSSATKLWAFLQMGLARSALSGVPGLRFWKLLGSGEGGGFSLHPDWSRYGLLAVWQNSNCADAFFKESELMRSYRQKAKEIWTIRLLTIQSHGLWSGVSPFLPVSATSDPALPVAVLTRAAIHWNRLSHFWRAVPATSRELNHAKGLLLSVGIGEAPFVRQATFSVWKSGREMQDFAYRTAVHKEIIRRTREENWYREDLFARFVPVSSNGLWGGSDPLKGLHEFSSKI